jgi:hypothetical protein
MPDGLTRPNDEFEKYGIDNNKEIICLWRNGQLNCAMRAIAQEHELIENVW